jgi:hypothetical protein
VHADLTHRWAQILRKLVYEDRWFLDRGQGTERDQPRGGHIHRPKEVSISPVSRDPPMMFSDDLLSPLELGPRGSV